MPSPDSRNRAATVQYSAAASSVYGSGNGSQPLSQLISTTQLDVCDVRVGKRSQHDPRRIERHLRECVGHCQEG